MTEAQPATCERFADAWAREPIAAADHLAHLADHYLAFVVGKPGTAEIAPTPRAAWERLKAAVGKIAPADETTAELVGWYYRVELFDEP